MPSPSHESSTPHGKLITQIWLPLAASWLLMGLERPIVTAFMARLEDPTINLAAYASAVFPLSLIIESPIIMLLAASTALSKNWTWYCFLRNFMVWLAAGLTLIHGIVAFTPLFDFLVSTVLKIPEAIVEPARIGMMLMTPWTASIAIRRFYQGILIRNGQSHWVGVGTATRLIALCWGLLLGFAWESPSGIIIGTFAISLGVLTEAIFIRICAQPILQQLKNAASSVEEHKRILTILYTAGHYTSSDTSGASRCQRSLKSDAITNRKLRGLANSWWAHIFISGNRPCLSRGSRSLDRKTKLFCSFAPICISIGLLQ